MLSAHCLRSTKRTRGKQTVYNYTVHALCVKYSAAYMFLKYRRL